MPDLLHVALFPADETGCGYYRMRLPAAHAGCVTSFHDRVRTRTSPNLQRGTVDLHSVDVQGADVAVFQRPMDSRLTPVIMQLKAQGVATVVELDDDLAALDPIHASWTGSHPRSSPHSNWNHLKSACREADLITVTTPALAHRYAGHGRVVVLPNCVERRVLDIRPEKAHALGWTGTVATHPRDLQVMGDAIARLTDGGAMRFAIIGDATGAKEALGVSEDAIWAPGWIDGIDAYYEAMGSIACGVVPLANSAFNHAKSHLKGLEFAALGVPFVASPLPEYLTLSAKGAGRLASKAKRWQRQIEHALMDDEAGPRGRAVVSEHYCIEDQGWRWTEAWERAVYLRRSAVSRAAAHRNGGRKVLA